MSARRTPRPSAPNTNNLTYFGDIDNRFLGTLFQRPKTLVFGSSGGCMYCMCAALDYLQTVPVKVYATGQCFSAAVPILACGAFRGATRRTRFMVHPGKAVLEAERALGDIKMEAEELDRMENIYLEVLAERSLKSKRWWAEKAAATYYFDATEAKRLGLIDLVV